MALTCPRLKYVQYLYKFPDLYNVTKTKNSISSHICLIRHDFLAIIGTKFKDNSYDKKGLECYLFISVFKTTTSTR